MLFRSMRTSMSCARRQIAEKIYAAAMPCGFATSAFVLAISTASAQSNPYSNPSVIVDLSVLEKFGPPPTLPGLLRQGGRSTGGQDTGVPPATRDGAAAGAPGRLLPPDRKSVVEGKSVSVRVDLGGGGNIKK